MKYTIKFDVKYTDDSSYLQIKINEEIRENDAVGDIIGIYKECNCLEFDECIDLDDDEIRDFIKAYFKNWRAVIGFIKKRQEYKK